ncbi:MAG: allantoinase AllB [Myxococcaceae bacterium]|nr:allantoinase AllB [Myxococcaceae bacterium]
MSDRVIRSRRIVTPEGLVDGAVIVRDGRIVEVARGEVAGPPGAERIDATAEVVMPAVVDCHAHINEPGRTEWEGFETATRAAAAGGIATVVDMPLNSIPPTTTLSALQTKVAAAEGRCAIDYGFWGGVVPENAGELERMVEAGALGFKAFLCPSGVDEFPQSTRADLDEAMPVLARAGVPLLVHAELENAAPASTGGEPRAYATWLNARPREWENAAVRMMIDLCRAHRCRVHIVHLSSADALTDIRRAREEGLPLTVETCPHYLTFSAEEIDAGATHFKCAPPIREAENRERLWDAVKDGTIDFVVSDHSPCTPALKGLETGDFGAAWGGIAGLQFSLPAVWTGMRARGLGLEWLARVMCERTAAFIGVSRSRGRIAPGLRADLVLFDPDADFTPQPKDVLHRHPLTPWSGRRLYGRVRTTFLAGERIYADGTFPAPPSGRRVTREA